MREGSSGNHLIGGLPVLPVYELLVLIPGDASGGTEIK